MNNSSIKFKYHLKSLNGLLFENLKKKFSDKEQSSIKFQDICAVCVNKYMR
jgi:hypothetical protein